MTQTSPSPDSFPTFHNQPSPYKKLPAPLAHATFALLEESLINSADELIYLLESWLTYLGWSWIAEYTHHPEAHDEALDLLLFQQLLESRRSPSVGTWAYIGSSIARTFRQHNWSLQQQPLALFAYGTPGDKTSTLSRLLAYRNNFAHGSFSAVIQDILTHRAMLWELVEPLILPPFPPLVFWDPEQGQWRNADYDATIYPQDIEFDKPPTPYQTLQRTTNGQWLDLTHMYHIQNDEETGLSLHPIALQSATHEERRAIFETNPRVYKHLQAYEDKRQGTLSFPPPDSVDCPLSLSQRTTYQERLRNALQQEGKNKPNFVLLLGYPGSGKTHFLTDKDFLSSWDHVIPYRITHKSITTSSTTFARYLVRKLHQIFELPPPSFTSQTTEELFEQLNTLLQKMGTSGQTLLITIDRFHEAYTPYREESHRLYDLLVYLHDIPGQNVQFLLAARPGYRDDLLRDHQLELPTAEYEAKERYHELLEDLGFTDTEDSPHTKEESHFRKCILHLLGKHNQPMTVFEMCDALRSYKEEHPDAFASSLLFTPHVERALWELRPTLRWGRYKNGPHESEKHFTCFCQAFAQWAQETLP